MLTIAGYVREDKHTVYNYLHKLLSDLLELTVCNTDLMIKLVD